MTKLSSKVLNFKEVRSGKIEKIEVYPLPKSFDAAEWARTGNNTYGPNYLINEKGEVIPVLPENYVGTDSNGGILKHNILSVYVADSEEAKKSLETFKTTNPFGGVDAKPTGSNESMSEANKLDKDPVVVRDTKNKKGKKN